MSDSPPSRARAMQSSPTISESSAWKNCLHYHEPLFTCISISRPHLPSIGSINTHFVDLRGILAEIFDVPEDVSSTVLAHEIA